MLCKYAVGLLWGLLWDDMVIVIIIAALYVSCCFDKFMDVQDETNNPQFGPDKSVQHSSYKAMFIFEKAHSFPNRVCDWLSKQ